MMDKSENNKDYLISEIKYQNFYILYNGIDEKSGKKLKDLVSYSIVKEKGFDYNCYEILIHQELVNVCYDLFKKQVKLIYDYLYLNDENLYFDDEKNLNKMYPRLPKNIIMIIEKNAGIKDNNLSLKEIIDKEESQDVLLYQIMAYNDSLREILEMFFETLKYEEMRKDYLQRDDGKEEALLLEQVKLKMFE